MEQLFLEVEVFTALGLSGTSRIVLCDNKRTQRIPKLIEVVEFAQDVTLQELILPIIFFFFWKFFGQVIVWQWQ